MYELEVPRFFDNHNHPSFYIMLSNCLSLEAAHTIDDARRVWEQLEPGRLHVVIGWHSERFSIDAQTLAPYPPLIVVNYCLHGYCFNEGAAAFLGQAGIDIAVGDAVRTEMSMGDILSFVCQSLPLTMALQSWANVRREWERLGLYGAADMLSLYPEFNSPEFPLERWLYPSRDPNWQPAADIAGLKLFNDGALGSRTSALAGGFKEWGTPVLTHTDEQLRERMEYCYHRHPNLAMHTIGDLATEQALRVYSAVKPELEAEGITPHLRLEHCQFMTKEQALCAKRLGLTLSVQPNFYYDSIQYADRLNQAQIEANNPLRMIIDEAGFQPGIDLLFGSDGMPVGVPMAIQSALFAAYASQRLTLEELYAGYRADSSRGTCKVLIDDERGLVTLA